jgi:hypothetical protein
MEPLTSSTASWPAAATTCLPEVIQVPVAWATPTPPSITAMKTMGAIHASFVMTRPSIRR